MTNEKIHYSYAILEDVHPYYKAYPDELFEGHDEHSGLNTTNA